jgi:hypothetical protein
MDRKGKQVNVEKVTPCKAIISKYLRKQTQKLSRFKLRSTKKYQSVPKSGPRLFRPIMENILVDFISFGEFL